MSIMLRLTYDFHAYFEYNVKNKQIIYNQDWRINGEQKKKEIYVYAYIPEYSVEISIVVGSVV